MEAYRLSSKLRQEEHEYLIQTANDASVGAIATSVYIDGVLAETSHRLHPVDSVETGILDLVRSTHDDKKQEIETLLQSYRQVLRTDNPQVMYHFASVLYHKGFYREAQQLLESIVVRSPEHHQVLNLLGITLLALGDIHAAARAAEQATSLRPQFADYHNNLGEIYLAGNAAAKALQQFDAAIGINLYYADAYFNRGVALLLQATTANREEASAIVAKAADALKKATLVMPEYAGPVFNEGMEAVSQKNLTAALRIFRSIRTGRKESKRQEMAELIARTPVLPDQISEQVLAERIVSLTREIARNPLYPDLHSDLAYCYIETARLACQKAADHLKRSIDLNSSLSQNYAAYEQVADVIERLPSIGFGIAGKTRE